MSDSFFNVAMQGFILNISLVVAIGAQNAFILQQGLKRDRVMLAVLSSLILNLFLIVAGVYGLGLLIVKLPIVKTLATWVAAIFLAIYALLSFKNAIWPKGLEKHSQTIQSSSLAKIVSTAFAFSWLNPHALLDSFLLIGGIGGQLPASQKMMFVFGVSFAELVWFSSLAFFAKFLSLWLRKPSAWRWIHTVIGIMMLSLAVNLVFEDIY